ANFRSKACAFLSARAALFVLCARPPVRLPTAFFAGTFLTGVFLIGAATFFATGFFLGSALLNFFFGSGAFTTSLSLLPTIGITPPLTCATNPASRLRTRPLVRHALGV